MPKNSKESRLSFPHPPDPRHTDMLDQAREAAALDGLPTISESLADQILRLEDTGMDEHSGGASAAASPAHPGRGEATPDDAQPQPQPQSQLQFRGNSYAALQQLLEQQMAPFLKRLDDLERNSIDEKRSARTDKKSTLPDAASTRLTRGDDYSPDNGLSVNSYAVGIESTPADFGGDEVETATLEAANSSSAAQVFRTIYSSPSLEFLTSSVSEPPEVKAAARLMAASPSLEFLTSSLSEPPEVKAAARLMAASNDLDQEPQPSSKANIERQSAIPHRTFSFIMPMVSSKKNEHEKNAAAEARLAAAAEEKSKAEEAKARAAVAEATSKAKAAEVEKALAKQEAATAREEAARAKVAEENTAREMAEMAEYWAAANLELQARVERAEAAREEMTLAMDRANEKAAASIEVMKAEAAAERAAARAEVKATAAKAEAEAEARALAEMKAREAEARAEEANRFKEAAEARAEAAKRKAEAAEAAIINKAALIKAALAPDPPAARMAEKVVNAEEREGQTRQAAAAEMKADMAAKREAEMKANEATRREAEAKAMVKAMVGGAKSPKSPASIIPRQLPEGQSPRRATKPPPGEPPSNAQRLGPRANRMRANQLRF